MSEPHVVRFSESHIEEAAQIEKATFSEPWSEEAMRLLCTEEYPSLALIGEEGELAGYVGASRALDELAIINVAVREDKRRRGYASMLLSELDRFCESEEIVSVSLEVRVSNTSAIALYEKHGYLRAGLRKRFYRLPTEDAIVMVKNFK